ASAVPASACRRTASRSGQTDVRSTAATALARGTDLSCMSCIRGTAGNRPAHSACGVKTGVAADSTTAAPDTDTAVRSVAPGSGVAVQGAALKPKPALVVDRSAQPGASAGTAALCRTSGAAQLSPATQRDLAQRQVSRPGRVVTGRRAVAC